jgi:hypothetical protein
MVVAKIAMEAAKAAAKLLKKPSIMVDDTKKFAGKYGKKLAEEHLGESRVKKAIASGKKKADKKKDKPVKKSKPKKKSNKQDLRHMTKEERKEYRKLEKEQKEDMKDEGKISSTAGGERQTMLIRPGRTRSLITGKNLKKSPRTKVEHTSGKLKSKGKLEKEDMRDFNPREKSLERRRPTPPYTVDQAADIMGLSEGYGKGQMKDIMENVASGNLTKKSKGGKIGSPRGVGKALRGWGKVI